MYYVARYNWATKGFEYETDYEFHDDHVCGHRVLTQHSGRPRCILFVLKNVARVILLYLAKLHLHWPSAILIGQAPSSLAKRLCKELIRAM